MAKRALEMQQHMDELRAMADATQGAMRSGLWG
jgi:hypothetical protein